MEDSKIRMKLFICHSKGDKEQVRVLYRKLRRSKFDPWLDEEKLIPGQNWDQEIRKAINDSQAIVVCLSRGSISKEGYVQKEIRLALDVADEKPPETIFLIPLRLEDCDIPLRLRKWQWVDLFETNGYQRLRIALDSRAEQLGLRRVNRRKEPHTVIASGERTIEILTDEILAGKHLSVACRWPSEENPITGTPLTPSRFIEKLITKARNSGIIVLDYDGKLVDYPHVYVLSYNFVEIASRMEVFSEWKKRFNQVMKADAKGNYDVSPWGNFDDRGAKLFSEAVRSLSRPVLVVARIFFDVDENGQGEPNYSHGIEIPVLSSSMSLVFDLWRDGDWRKISRILDYFVDDIEGKMKLVRGSRPIGLR